MSTAAELPSDQSELRQRQAHGTEAPNASGPDSGNVAAQNQGQSVDGDLLKDKGKKTFGRTPDGTGKSPFRPGQGL